MSITYTLKSYGFLFGSCFSSCSYCKCSFTFLSKYDKFVWVNVVFIVNQDKKLKKIVRLKECLFFSFFFFFPESNLVLDLRLFVFLLFHDLIKDLLFDRKTKIFGLFLDRKSNILSSLYFLRLNRNKNSTKKKIIKHLKHYRIIQYLGFF